MLLSVSSDFTERIDRAAAVVYRVCEGEVSFLLVSSSGDRQRLVLPAGGIEKGETPATAAVREVYEEAGVRAASRQRLGLYHHTKPNGQCRLTEVVLAEPLACEPSPEGRDVYWLTLEQVDRVAHRLSPGVRAILGRVADRLPTGVAA